MRIGVADTTFARVDMASFAVETLLRADRKLQIEQYTVPGFKDLPVAAKKLIEEYHCDIVLAFGWVGKEDIDEVCSEYKENRTGAEIEQFVMKYKSCEYEEILNNFKTFIDASCPD